MDHTYTKYDSKAGYWCYSTYNSTSLCRWILMLFYKGYIRWIMALFNLHSTQYHSVVGYIAGGRDTCPTYRQSWSWGRCGPGQTRWRWTWRCHRCWVACSWRRGAVDNKHRTHVSHERIDPQSTAQYRCDRSRSQMALTLLISGSLVQIFHFFVCEK